MWAREPGRVRSSLRGTDTDGYRALRATNFVVVFCGWTLRNVRIDTELTSTKNLAWGKPGVKVSPVGVSEAGCVKF